MSLSGYTGNPWLSSYYQFIEKFILAVKIMNVEKPDVEQLFSELDTLAHSFDNFKESVNSCLDKVMTVMDATRGFLLLCKGSESEWKPLAGKNINLDTLFETEAVSKTIVRAVAGKNMAIITTNALADPRFSNKQSVVTSEIRSVICAPLLSGKGLFGVIYLDNRFSDKFFNGNDREYIIKCAEKLSKIITQLPGNPV
jgi:transcriptional regulator with GAF, ATPase, and Fis domain